MREKLGDRLEVSWVIDRWRYRQLCRQNVLLSIDSFNSFTSNKSVTVFRSLNRFDDLEHSSPIHVQMISGVFSVLKSDHRAVVIAVDKSLSPATAYAGNKTASGSFCVCSQAPLRVFLGPALGSLYGHAVLFWIATVN